MLPRRALLSFVLILFLLTGSSSAYAQQQDKKFFPKFGHWVSGEFLAMYNSVSDPARIFGDPITIVFEDPVRPGIQLQYFERVRMDYDPSKPAGEQLTLADLGAFVNNDAKPGEPLDISTNTPMCSSFPNNKYVCYGFKQLYDRFDGAKYFGQPVTNAEFVDGLQVQYFAHVRMEWRNEMPTGQKVVISELGRIDFDKRIGDPRLLAPEDGYQAYNLQLQAYAFVDRPLVAKGQEQQVNVLVYDQHGRPLKGASVVINVIYPDGRSENQLRTTQTTNDLGFTQGKFTVRDIAPNQVVQVNVEAQLPNVTPVSASTWFRVWW